MSEVAVGLFIVLPWYMAELGKVGITRSSLLVRLWLPLFAAAIVGIEAHAVAGAISQAFAACAVSGALGLVVIGLLGYRLRSVITGLRAALHAAAAAGPADEKPELSQHVPADPPREPATPSSEITPMP
jgi:hypothetical protein